MATTLEQTAVLLDRRRLAAEQALAARVANARTQLPDVANCLLGEFGATRVWLFGSFAVGPLHDGSDVDIAVEGLSSERYFSALAAVGQLVDLPIDLVRVEDSSPSLRARIVCEGVMLAG